MLGAGFHDVKYGDVGGWDYLGQDLQQRAAKAARSDEQRRADTSGDPRLVEVVGDVVCVLYGELGLLV